MYAYHPDSFHLIFQDCFGLSRVSFGKKHKVKTDQKELASPYAARVSMTADGAYALTYRDVIQKTTMWSVFKMTVKERFSRFRRSRAVIHPFGSHMIYWHSGKASLFFEPYQADTNEQHVSLAREGDTGFPDDLWMDLQSPIVTGRQGSFAAIGEGTVVSGFIREDSVEITGYTPLETGGHVQLFASPEGASAVTHLEKVSTVYAPDGRVFTLASITPAQVGGGYVVWQPDAATVARRALDGEETEHFTLEGDDVGHALLYPDEERLCVVPWHREDVLSLLDGQRVSRKLKPALLEARRAMLEHIRPFVHAASELAIGFEFAEILVNPKHQRIESTLRYSRGQQSLEAWMLVWLLFESHHDDFGDWAVNGFGMLGPGRDLEPYVDVNDDLVRAAAESLETHGVRVGRLRVALADDDRVSASTLEWLASRPE